MGNRYEALQTHLQKGSLWVATVLRGTQVGDWAIWDRDGQLLQCKQKQEHNRYWQEVMESIKMQGDVYPAMLSHGKETLYVERLVQEPELVICGGGHISQELAVLADYLGYPYVILDDREEFANETRFPNAVSCICAPFSKGLGEGSFSSNAYYIIVTRGHKADLECLELILGRPYGYVGMIGSRSKVAKTMMVLTEKGYDTKVLEQIHAPIGLKIGGETPKEIGISIVAQLIQEKNKENPASYLEAGLLEQFGSAKEGIVVTIIGKRGSAPRGIGSRMIVGSKGIMCGTIGGGLVEFEAEKQGRVFLQSGTITEVTKTYHVNESSAAALGMWCGGEVDVMFEWL